MPEVSPLEYIEIDEEPSGSYAVDRTSGGTFLYCPHREGSLSMNADPGLIEPGTAVQRLDQYVKLVQGPKRPSIGWEMNLPVMGGAAGDGVASKAKADAVALRAMYLALGGIDEANVGTTVSAGSSVTDFTVASAAGLTKGGAYGWVNSAGRMEAREVGALSGSDVTARIAHSAGPGAGVIYGATTVYPTEDQQASWQVKHYGVHTTDRKLFRGLQVDSMAMAFDFEDLARLTVQLSGADWDLSSAASSAFNTGIIPLGSLSNFQEIAAYDSEVIATPVATSTRTVLDVAAFGFNFAIAYINAPSPSGTNGILRKRRNRTPPSFEITWNVYAETEAWYTAAQNRDFYYVQAQVGSVPGFTQLHCFPNAQIVDAQREDLGGLQTVKVTARATIDTDDTSELTRAAYRHHQL